MGIKICENTLSLFIIIGIAGDSSHQKFFISIHFPVARPLRRKLSALRSPLRATAPARRS